MLPVCHQQTKTEIKTFKPLGHVLYPAAGVICMSLDCEGETPGGNQGVGEHHCPSCEIHLQRKRGKGSTGWEADLLQLSKCDNLTGIVLNLHHSGWSWQTATLRLSIRYAWHRQVKYSLSLEKGKSYITVLPASPPPSIIYFSSLWKWEWAFEQAQPRKTWADLTYDQITHGRFMCDGAFIIMTLFFFL